MEVKQKLDQKARMSAFLDLKDVPNGIPELIDACLNYEPHQRPSFEQIQSKLTEIQPSISNQTWNTFGAVDSLAWSQGKYLY